MKEKIPEKHEEFSRYEQNYKIAMDLKISSFSMNNYLKSQL